MIPIVTFLLLLAQVPPGDSYDPAKHVNPIITFVQSKDFRPSNHKDAGEMADIALIGLSSDTGTLETVELAEAGMQNVRQGRTNLKVTFYPVVRQTFKLSDGAMLILHSFKNPRVAGSGSSNSPIGLGIPIPRGRDPKDKRFGDGPAPEQLEVRGTPGLLFEKDGNLTVAWQEDGVTHTATASIPRRAFFRIINDLL